MSQVDKSTQLGNGGLREQKSYVLSLLRGAAAIVVLGALCAIVSNSVRTKTHLAWFQNRAFDTVVPCPEPVGEATSILPTSAALRDFTSLIIDARSSDDFSAWHFPGAINVPFDWLGPPLEDEIKAVAKRVTASNSKRVIIYGDGDNPDSGREWARLLSGGGIRNVSYVEGGAPKLKPPPDLKLVPSAEETSR